MTDSQSEQAIIDGRPGAGAALMTSLREDAGRLHLTLTFPDRDYEDEFGAARLYLPEETSVDAADLAALQASGTMSGSIAELVRRRVVVDLPKRYY